VVVHDAGFDDGRPYLVMELVAGASLQQRLASGPLTQPETVGVGAALADALSCVHAAGIVHRDVKPANVLLEPAGSGWPVVKLADFGIARLASSPPLTATGLTIGTANYLSPEQVRGAEVGPPADIYALGLVLIECLTGRPAYAGTGVEVALARLHRDPDLPAGVPDPLRRLLRAMTDREPTGRPTAAAVAAQLRGTAVHPVGPDDGTALIPTVPDVSVERDVVGGTAVLRTRVRSIRRPDVLALVAVAVLVVAVVLAALVTATNRGTSGPPHYPAVPGRLGTHLSQLERAVG
jgi:serine/threonine protein kinase